jgi:hypothetical protein
VLITQVYLQLEGPVKDPSATFPIGFGDVTSVNHRSNSSVKDRRARVPDEALADHQREHAEGPCALLLGSMRARWISSWPKARWALGAVLLAFASLAYLFPGARLCVAFTIATGIGRARLQQRIDELENRAIRHRTFSDADRAFLVDFYTTLATGGKLVVVARQTGRMMDHYLARSGSDYRLEPEIFTGNEKVRLRAVQLQKHARAGHCVNGQQFSSGTFYMPDSSNVDSVFGLYYGRLQVTEQAAPTGRCTLHFRAEVPWVWPSYSSIEQKYGDAHAESFPLPSLISLLFGQKHALFVDNGLGQQLEELGLAKSFLAFAEWSES